MSGITTYADRIVSGQSESQILVGSTTVGTAGSLCISATNITQYETDGSYVEWSTNGIQSVSSTFDISGNITFAGTGNSSTSNGWVLTSNGIGAPTFQEFTSYADLDQVCNSMMSDKPNYTTQSLNVVDNISSPTYQTALYDYKLDISQNAGGYQNQAIITTAVNSTSSGLYFNSSTSGAQVGQITLDTLNYLMMEGENTSTAIQMNTTDLSMCANNVSYSNKVLLTSNASDIPQLVLTTNDTSHTFGISLHPNKLLDYVTLSGQDIETNMAPNYFKFNNGNTLSLLNAGGNAIIDVSGSLPQFKIKGDAGQVGQVITNTMDGFDQTIQWSFLPFFYYVEPKNAPYNYGSIPWSIIHSSLTSLTNVPIVIMTADSGNISVCIPISSAGSTTTDLYWTAGSNISSASIIVYSRG